MAEQPAPTTSYAATSYTATKLTIGTALTYPELESRFEAAVPFAPIDQLVELAARSASWQEVQDLTDKAATYGFLLYHKNPFARVMHLAGHTAAAAAYLIGNHAIAERMYRHDPSVMLHAPLRAMLRETESGTASLAIDLPSAQFAVYGIPEITEVGVELDRKFAALLRHLGITVPDELLNS